MTTDKANTTEKQTNTAGETTLECLYCGMSTEALKEKQILSLQIFVAAVSSPMWAELPPATKLDMCMLMDTLHLTMTACQEVYLDGWNRE